MYSQAKENHIGLAKFALGASALQTVLGGSFWVVIRGVIARVTMIISGYHLMFH